MSPQAFVASSFSPICRCALCIAWRTYQSRAIHKYEVLVFTVVSAADKLDLPFFFHTKAIVPIVDDVYRYFQLNED